jgi:hypothetical protein
MNDPEMKIDDLLKTNQQATPEPLPAGTTAPALLKELSKSRRDAALAEVAARFDEFRAGLGALALLTDAIHRLRDAEVQLSDDPQSQYAACDRAYQLFKIIEAINEARFQAGRIAVQDLAQARYHRLAAEIERLRARMRMEKLASNIPTP